MTPAAVAALIETAPLPPGYDLAVKPRRQFKYRSLWVVMVVRDGAIAWHRDYYNVAAGIREAQRWAWDRVPLTITTDADGWITSMEPTE